MPLDESVKAWDDAKSRCNLRDVTVVRLPGADHLPTVGGEPDPDAVTVEYSRTLTQGISTAAAGAAD